MNPTGPDASLYVGDLHPDVTEAMLFQKFSTVGQILSIRVCRDMDTRRSLGYAYVNFQQPADAEKALNNMNFDIMKDRPIKIMWSQRDPSQRKPGELGKIFIQNLDKSIDNKALYDTFSVFGTVLACEIAADETGSKGYGFVHFKSEEAAKQAIEKVNGLLLNGKKVHVGKFVSGKGTKQFNNVYIENLSNEIDDQRIRDLCEKYGKVISAKVLTDDTGHSLGFGYVVFEEPEGAERAADEINDMEVDGRLLSTCQTRRRPECPTELHDSFDKLKIDRSNRYEGLNLYVKNLDDVVDEEALMREFSHFGRITSAKVMREDGRSKGFGFVCFSSPEAASKAVAEMNGHIIVSKPLYVNFAQSKEDRRAHLATQYMQGVPPIRQQQPAQQFNQQLYQPTPATSYFVPPAVPQAQGGYFPQTQHAQMQQIRASPRWQTQVHPNQPGGGFQGMPISAQMQAMAPRAGQPAVHAGVNARPITGQPAMPPSVSAYPMAGQPAGLYYQEDDAL